MTLTARLRAWRYAAAIEEVRGAYAAPLDEDARVRIQLESLNREWGRILANVPHYSKLRSAREIPERFDSLEEFAERVPPTARPDVQRHLAAMTSGERSPEFARITGGSSAQPVQIPAWSSEVVRTRPDMWLGRSWYGIGPESRMFLLWGHSHLLGTGARGRLRRWRVRINDRLLGYRRFSAYDLRPERLREAALGLIRSRPEALIGYSVALDLFARHNGPLRAELRGLGLRAVIGTAESFPSDESVARLEDLLGCPVAMEYGAVETGLIAHTRPDGGYGAFWRTYVVEAQPHGAGHRVLVTSLYPRCFPLVRYDMGDEVVLADRSPGPHVGLRAFERVIGRCNDYVTLEDGALIHSEVFSHAVRPCAEVSAYQVQQDERGIRLCYLASRDLPRTTIDEIRLRLARSHRDLDQISIERVTALQRTVAGKTPMVVRRAAGAVSTQAAPTREPA